MKKYLGTIITVIVVITFVILGFVLNPIKLSPNQKETLIILVSICGGSAAYCFIVGEITMNNSQMDKLWSLLPIAYAWVIAYKSNYNPRQVIMAVLVTLWALRLTVNFARKGAYTFKFWTGEEDYRWPILRSTKYFQKRPAWALFDLFFISIYQNALVLAICLTSFASMESLEPLGTLDYFGIGFASIFLLIETAADEQQMFFHTTKRNLLKEGKTLEELSEPFNKGFNTIGLWNRSRHPNYLGEQGFWLSLYFFVLGSKAVTYNFFSWSLVGPLLLVLLFLGSSSMQENISASKYPEYKNYIENVSKYIPLRKYRE